MKKLLGISVIAMLAVAPAFADVVSTGTTPTTADPQPTGSAAEAVMASGAPLYQLATSHANDAKAASAGYVKGAYNAAIKAVNKVADIKQDKIDSTHKLSVELVDGALTSASLSGYATEAYAQDGSHLTSGTVAKTALATGVQTSLDKADSAVQSVAEGSTNGTIAVDGTDVAVHGLGSAAYTASTAYATSAQGTKADNAETAIGTMSNLQTTANTLVGAINEVRTTANGALTATGTATLTNKSIDGDDNTITDLGFNTLKSDAVVKSTDDSGNGIAATSDASDSKLVTEKAVAAEIDSAITGLGMSNYATITGVDNTINGLSATVNDGFALTSGAVSGTASVAIMDTWGSDTPATTPLAVTHNLTVDTAITEGTVTINKQAYASANQ